MFSERKLALRFKRPTAWYGFASVTTVVALAVVVSLLTWWNDLYKPIVHPIEAIKGIHPENVLEQVDNQVATLLGVDEETVRTVRKGLTEASSGVPQLGGKLYEVATKQPASTDSAASTPTILQTRNTVEPPAFEEPSPTPNEPPPPIRDEQPPPTETPPPAPSEPPPPTTDTPPPTTGEPQPPTADQPPPPTGSPPPPTSQPPTTNQPPPPTDQPPPPTNQPLPQPPTSQPPSITNQSPSTPAS